MTNLVIEKVTDEPSCHLQRPPSDEGSTQAFLEDPVSSRFGGNSQPQPLSHSLLSRLELSENDPNTFRDIIDDLTVQNKNLKRQLKRYEKIQSIGKEHNGLFEVRIHSLPPDKKHELEVILQNFTATIYSLQHKSGSMLPTGRRQSLHQASNTGSKLSLPSPPSVQALDSAYASVSATGVAVPTISNSSTRPGTVLHKQTRDATFHGTSSTPQPPNDAMILDRKKQEFIVQKLEQLFDNDLRDFEVLNEADKSLKNVQHRPLVAPITPVVTKASARPLDESVWIRRENIHSAGGLPDHRSLTGNFFSQRNEAIQCQQRLSPDEVRHSRHLRGASPIAEPSPQATHEWVYLNLLANMAQLHTLNVTPEFVRKAIHDSSTKLVLSDDGCRVRRRGYSQETGMSPDESCNSAASPLTSSAMPSSVKKLEPDRRSLSTTRKDSAQENSTSYLKDTGSAGRHRSSMLKDASVSSLHYKPMFAPRKRRSSQTHDTKDDRSVDSDTTSSSMASGFAQTKTDNQSGPMIFLDRDPFFLDLSRDLPDCDRLDRAPYGRLVEEPLGGHDGTTETYRESERRSSSVLPAVTGEAVHNGSSVYESIPFPSLTIYDDDPPSPPGNSTTGAGHKELEASGIGGIQLDDNFAIEVKTEQPSSSQPLPPYIDGRPSQTMSRLPNRVILTTHHVPAAHHRQLISATTTHLPPSPLPPPSYVYPAFSSYSSSHSGSDDDILNDVDTDSELVFRPLSLSPQMRMFLEREEEASEPEEDEDMEVDDEI
ncbi:MAG: hypothetical protein Q9226_000487 [Calogaya cf. arnoldii]